MAFCRHTVTFSRSLSKYFSLYSVAVQMCIEHIRPIPIWRRFLFRRHSTGWQCARFPCNYPRTLIRIQHCKILMDFSGTILNMNGRHLRSSILNFLLAISVIIRLTRLKATACFIVLECYGLHDAFS